MDNHLDTDKFWSDDPGILINPNRFIEFYLHCDMTVPEKLNAIARFFIYISILLVSYKKDFKYMMIGIGGLIATFFIRENTKENFDSYERNREQPNFNKDTDLEKSRGDQETLPTLNNPFMNKLVLDPPNKPLAKEYYENNDASLNVKKDMTSKFEQKLYQDVDDVYGSANASRHFYTVPDNDTNGDFKHFLYGNMHSAKENTYNSFKNLSEPLQAKRNTNK